MAACDISGFSGHLAAVGLRHYHWRKPTAAASMVASSASSSTEGGSLEGRRMFVFGMGFVGRYVSTRLRGEGWEVSGTCTSVAKKKELEEMGFNAFVFDASENELAWLTEQKKASMAGVFIINNALDTIINHEALSKYQKMRDSRKYTARVHVADIYQTINASFTIPSTGRVYNVVDDDPAPRAEVFAFAQDLIEERWPGMIKRSVAMDTTDPEMRQDDMKGEKRVSNARLKDLGVSLIHPSYRSGLRSILDSWESPLQ
uniref:UDP-N-acetyl-D-mannosamine dehydrogenase n=1 Tax=Anthurium amnicola TaxID=1678845 RepID=A0A1D1YX68_9ARAE